MGVAYPEDSGFSLSRNLSLWWTEETEYVLQRLERWAAYARGYNRLRTARLSPGRMTMEAPSERARLACCTCDYKSNGNVEGRCLESYSLDHSIYFKTVGEIRKEAVRPPTPPVSTRPSGRLDCGDFLASDFDEEDEEEGEGEVEEEERPWQGRPRGHESQAHARYVDALNNNLGAVEH